MRRPKLRGEMLVGIIIQMLQGVRPDGKKRTNGNCYMDEQGLSLEAGFV